MTQLSYIARRLGSGVLVLAVVSMLAFALLEIAPGEFVDEMKVDPQISPEVVASLRTRYGLDRPVVERYLAWLRSAQAGEFGYSFAYNVPVSVLIGPRVVNTLILTGTATALAWLIALPLGVWTAARRGGWLDRGCGAVTSALMATPDLVIAIALLWAAVHMGRLPAAPTTALASGASWSSTVHLLEQLMLPAASLTLVLAPLLYRHIRSAMLDALGAPSVKAATRHGLSPSRILYRHALPLTANVQSTLFGLSIATLLSSSLLIEVLMSWPGLGPLLLEAILARDVHIVVTSVLLSATLLLGGNLVADLIGHVADPRVRAS